MSRIRTVKPSFWTSSQVVSCTPLARLLFIGMWNFADDRGVHAADPVSLRMEVLPGGDTSADQVTALMGELIAAGLVREYEVDGRRFWLITGWHHQKIERPSYRYPPPTSAGNSANDHRTLDDGSANDHRTLDDGSANDHRTLDDGHPPEGKGMEGSNYLSDPSGSDVRSEAADPQRLNDRKHPSTPPCPHEEIIALYHETLPMCPRMRVWHRTRRGYLAARWREDPKRQTLDWWREFFGYVAQSKFLTGAAGGRGDRPPFFADLEWLVKPTNFAKAVEGRYHQQVRRA